MKLVLIVKNPSPLCFRTSRADKNVTTFHYIPGPALLGGLAAAHFRMGRSHQEEFAEFFTSGKIRFGNLYPANFKNLKDYHYSPVCPVPATAVSCKRFDGFKYRDDPDEDENERHGVSDRLISWALFSLSGMTDAGVLTEGKDCSCGLPTSPFSGFYRKGNDWNQLAAPSCQTRIITRTGVSRKRGAVMEQILYNREVIEEHQTFWGILDVEGTEQIEILKEFLDNASHNELIYLGNNKTRGLGRITITHCAARDNLQQITDTEPDPIRERVNTFNRKLREKAEKYKVPIPHDTLYIPVTLLSDIILKDNLLRCQTELTADYFSFRWGIEGMKPVYQSLSTRRVMGWNSVYKLPDADDVSITMGSVFLFAYTGQVNDDFWKTLYQIQSAGIGERRQEGFGQITIADPFHTEVNET
jgi:CRISPR-associated protein Csx10